MAVMPSLQLGQNQNLVYLTGSQNGVTIPDDQVRSLSRYDVQTQVSTTITNGLIKTAQFSQDGQWILLTAQDGSVSEIQLVRIDGKYRQILYCAPADQQIAPTNFMTTTGVQWSLDQTQVIFAQGTNAAVSHFYLLNLNSGSVQLELSLSPGDPSLLPSAWIDSTHIFVGTNSSLYLLDTSKGSNQHFSDLKMIIGPHDSIVNYTNDGNTLYMSAYVPQGQGNAYPVCTIYTSSIADGKGANPISCNGLPVSGLRMGKSGSANLLLSVYEQSGPAAQNNGLWKINTDGTGLTRINKVTRPAFWGPFNPFTSYAWSNISRDGSFYVYGLFYGSLNGGSVHRYSTNDNALPIGWTTI